jgi:hypothetical protein
VENDVGRDEHMVAGHFEADQGEHRRRGPRQGRRGCPGPGHVTERGQPKRR